MDTKTDANGFQYYDSLPEGWRKGCSDDFFDKFGKFIKDKPYLIQSFHSGKFEAYRTKSKDLISKIKPWLDEGRVFVVK
jgi:hypothetical protein